MVLLALGKAPEWLEVDKLPSINSIVLILQELILQYGVEAR